MKNLGRCGFESAESAIEDAERTISVNDYAVLHNETSGDYGWCWPQEYAERILSDSIVRVDV